MNKITSEHFWQWIKDKNKYYDHPIQGKIWDDTKLFRLAPQLLMGYMIEYCFQYGITFDGATNYQDYHNNLVEAINGANL